MNCQKAQACIDQYLNGTISDNDLEEFVYHIRNCQACYEDLEIYYIVDMAQKYLDEDQEESYNISQLLEEDIHDKLTRMHKRQHLRTFVFIVGCLMLGLAVTGVCIIMGYL
ncbi:zf-HC2 domain-containing protein [Lawsonibacter sp. OA9]|uniref:zf-HC2 domain-containing protein n=1 Tax=Oscillospiraceae TaxID=216572 RepID=UPI001F05C800|nr:MULTISPECIES: zf-HC2 domain-containing protein [Oscillospiraceae]MCH1978167.1 zf-HC2 domain-containing protein [Lawsonibacter sp. OA9]MCH1983713.1 zf-HC2 domain-containing protein [Ruminococcus sp. OA3]